MEGRGGGGWGGGGVGAGGEGGGEGAGRGGGEGAGGGREGAGGEGGVLGMRVGCCPRVPAPVQVQLENARASADACMLLFFVVIGFASGRDKCGSWCSVRCVFEAAG